MTDAEVKGRSQDQRLRTVEPPKTATPKFYSLYIRSIYPYSSLDHYHSFT